MLVETAAFLGEQLRSILGGNWDKGKDERVVLITNMNAHLQSPSYTVLRFVIDAWVNQDVTLLMEDFILQIDSKFPEAMEKLTELSKRWKRIHKIIDTPKEDPWGILYNQMDDDERSVFHKIQAGEYPFHELMKQKSSRRNPPCR
jgi:hypothetical protein